MIRTLYICVSVLLASAAAAADGIETTAPAAPREKEHAQAAHEAKAQEAKKHADAIHSADAGKTAVPGGDVKMSGMSVLGNDDSPKSLVIVPWKSSQLGAMPGLSKMLDDSTQPVDKEVFMRELSYYQIKVDSK